MKGYILELILENKLVLLFDENCPKQKDILGEGLQKQILHKTSKSTHSVLERVFLTSNRYIYGEYNVQHVVFVTPILCSFVTDSVLQDACCPWYDDIRFLSVMGFLYDQCSMQCRMKPQKPHLKIKGKCFKVQG